MPKAGFEPAHLAAPPPQDGVSANSTTSAFKFFIGYGMTKSLEGVQLHVPYQGCLRERNARTWQAAPDLHPHSVSSYFIHGETVMFQVVQISASGAV